MTTNNRGRAMTTNTRVEKILAAMIESFENVAAEDIEDIACVIEVVDKKEDNIIIGYNSVNYICTDAFTTIKRLSNYFAINLTGRE